MILFYLPLRKIAAVVYSVYKRCGPLQLVRIVKVLAFIDGIKRGKLLCTEIVFPFATSRDFE